MTAETTTIILMKLKHRRKPSLNPTIEFEDRIQF